jgi:hypothetical protein
MTIYILTTHLSITPLYYTTIKALLVSQENPISISPRRWSQLAKSGYPFTYKGCEIQKVHAVTLAEARAAALNLVL